jgi:hypothetical protein
MEIDGAAGDLTIESCGQLPLHRLGRSSRSSSIVAQHRAAQPRARARVTAANMVNADLLQVPQRLQH